MLPFLLAASLAITPTWVRNACTHGQPCGNSCISWDKMCQVGSGSSTVSPDFYPHLVVGGVGSLLLLANAAFFVGAYPESSSLDDDVRARRILILGGFDLAAGALYTGIGGALFKRDRSVPEHMIAWGVTFLTLGTVHLIFGGRMRKQLNELSVLPDPWRRGLVFQGRF